MNQKPTNNAPKKRSNNNNPNKKRRPQSKNKSNANRNRRPKSLTPLRIAQKYDNLQEQHVIARRKYYEMHGRVQGKQLARLESNNIDTLKAIRDFEASLVDWKKDVLEKKINMFPKDTIYSKRTEEVADRVDFVGDFEDPHLTDIQKESNYSDDKDESMGSIDDYYLYKGIEPKKEIEEPVVVTPAPEEKPTKS